MTNGNITPAVQTLDGVIRNAHSRRQFKADPRATLLAAGADPDDVPEAVWEVLVGMTSAELDAVSRLGVAMEGAGLMAHGIII